MATINFDITTLGLPSGTYNISVKGVAEKYADSQPSNTEQYEVTRTMPPKGSLITMNLDGTNRQYRVLKTDGDIAEVFTMFVVGEKTKYGTSQNYPATNCILRQVLEAWYASLSEDAKAAIVSKTFQQDMWRTDADGSPVYNGYRGSTKPGTSAYSISFSRKYGGIISAKVYPLSVQDVLDYILDTNITDGQLQNYNIWKMFWNDEVRHDGEDFWLLSAFASNQQKEFILYAYYGSFSSAEGSRSDDIYKQYPRAAFQIDLSKIEYTIST